MDTPCPPYYAEPTHEQTLLFSTSSYVRRGEEWYQCLEGAYCNAPSFLGYNPPGEGELWWQAWTRLDEGYPCNAELEESSSRGNGASVSEESGTSDLFKVTNKPTNRPTRPEEAPSLISGAVWYDANGDGRKNTLSNAQTRTDYDAASKERGAGMSNVQITLRDCKTDELVGVTYTFPRSFGLGGEGAVEVVDASYLESMQSQGGQDAILNDGLGIGNSDGKLGYYSFRILPFQLPGEFYVVMEAPEGYRLTGGSGDYWEVYEAALHDNVQPLMEAPWLKSEQGTGNRALQNGNATATGGTALQGNEQEKPPERPKGPIKHSGSLARSGCIPIQKSPARVTGMDAGLAVDSWPLRPYQYASLVVTVKFYNFGGRRRNLQILESLECRKYKKLLSEGIEVEDIWGCEAGIIGGAGGPLIEYVELTLDEGDIVVASLKEFLDSRVSRVWTIRSISIAHQKMTNLDYNGGGGGRRLGSRQLQANREVARLELGLRIRAEFSSDRGNTDLADVIASSIRNGKDSLLSVWKGLPANAGELEVRDILWQPEPEKPVMVEEDPVVEEAAAAEDVPVTALEYQQEDAASESGGVSAGLIAGVVVGLVAILAIVAGLLIYRRRTKEGSSGDDESSQPVKKESKGLKWWQRQNSKKKGASKAKKKKKLALGRRPAKKNELEGSSEEEESSYDDDDDDFDDLSSRWFSDSSKYDPETRMKEVDDHFDVHSQAYSESTGYSRRLSDGSGSRSSFNSGSIGSYDSGYSSRTPSGRSRRSRQNPLRSSGRTNRSSMTSARSSMNSIALQESGLYSIREAASLEASSAEYSSSKGSYSTRDSRGIHADSSSSRGDSSADYSSSRGSYSTRDSRGDSSADYNSSMGSSANYSSSRGSYSTRDSRAKRKSRTRRVT